MLTKRSQGELAARIVAEIQPLLRALRPQLAGRTRLAKLLDEYHLLMAELYGEKPRLTVVGSKGRAAGASSAPSKKRRSSDDQPSLEGFAAGDDDQEVWEDFLDGDEDDQEEDEEGTLGFDDDEDFGDEADSFEADLPLARVARSRRQDRAVASTTSANEGDDDDDDSGALDPMKKARMAWLSIWYRVERNEIAKEWQDFERFVADVGTPPVGMRTRFTRLDPKLAYGPGNCVWRQVAREVRAPEKKSKTPPRAAASGGGGGRSAAAAAAAEHPKRRSYRTRLAWQGRSLTINEWARELGFSYNVISDRLKAGWSVEEALATPVNRKKARRGASGAASSSLTSKAAKGSAAKKAKPASSNQSGGATLLDDGSVFADGEFPFPFADSKANFVPKTILRKRQSSKKDAGGASPEGPSFSH